MNKKEAIPAKHVTVIMRCAHCGATTHTPLTDGVPLDSLCDECAGEEPFMEPTAILIAKEPELENQPTSAHPAHPARPSRPKAEHHESPEAMIHANTIRKAVQKSVLKHTIKTGEPGEEISAETILEAIDRAEIFNIEKTVDPKTGEATFMIEENCDDYYAVFLSRDQIVTLALELLAMTHPNVKTHNEPEFDCALEHEIETSPHAIGGGPIFS